MTKTVRGMSALTVQAAGGGSENGSPNFEKESVGRDVLETADVGEAINGGAVTATVRCGYDTATTGQGYTHLQPAWCVGYR